MSFTFREALDCVIMLQLRDKINVTDNKIYALVVHEIKLLVQNVSDQFRCSTHTYILRNYAL